MDNKNNELVELRKKIEADLDKMTADQMKAFAVNMCYAYHKELNELNVSQDVKTTLPAVNTDMAAMAIFRHKLVFSIICTIKSAIRFWQYFPAGHLRGYRHVRCCYHLLLSIPYGPQ